jgi:asparagine N-glycosylation enzyme membrane subunit Stt3
MSTLQILNFVGLTMMGIGFLVATVLVRRSRSYKGNPFALICASVTFLIFAALTVLGKFPFRDSPFRKSGVEAAIQFLFAILALWIARMLYKKDPSAKLWGRVVIAAIVLAILGLLRI